LSLTENRYSGIPTIFRSMKEGGNPDPVFESSRGIFTVTLRKSSAFGTLQITRGYNFSNSDQLILEFCKTPKTRKEIAGYCSFKSVSYFYKMYMAPLVEKKLLLMSNPEHPKSPTQTYTTATEYFTSS